jgi:PAS domain S-box-containing protein
MSRAGPRAAAPDLASDASGQPSILLVDDQEMNLRALEALLQDLGKPLVTARSGQQALQLLFDRTFALILLDVRMPDMDGYETAEHIRRRARSAHTPIIFITAADATPQEVARGYSVGAVDYIFKPFMPEVLKAKVRIFLDLFTKTQELRESESRFRALVTNVPGALYRRAAAGTGDFLYVSEPIERITGWPASEFMDRGRPFKDLVHPDDAPAAAEAAVKAARDGSPYAVEYRILHRDGTVRTVVDRGLHIDGHLDGLILDITERKHAELELRRAKDLAEESNRELESFSYSVSHDLRAPLRTIEGFSKIVIDQYEKTLDDEGRHLLNRIRAGSQRMAHLIDDLLGLSRVTLTAMRTGPVDLTQLSGEVATELARAHPDRHVDFVCEPGLKANADGRLLRVALQNLIGNAWKFTGKSPAARIEVGRERKNGKTAFFVRDNGAGFDPAYTQKLFGPFQRLHSESEFEGTGIGLATVQRIVRRHGGDAWAEGAVDRGATFYFTLGAEGA